MTKEEKREYNRKYYLSHREEVLSQKKQYAKEYYKENRNRIIERVNCYRKNHWSEHYDNRIEQTRKYRFEIRSKALDLYGHKCELCGSVDHLEFHHLNLDGEDERKIHSSTKIYKSLADGNKRSDLQLLCRSCHHKTHNDLRSSI